MSTASQSKRPERSPSKFKQLFRRRSSQPQAPSGSNPNSPTPIPTPNGDTHRPSTSPSAVDGSNKEGLMNRLRRLGSKRVPQIPASSPPVAAVVVEPTVDTIPMVEANGTGMSSIEMPVALTLPSSTSELYAGGEEAPQQEIIVSATVVERPLDSPSLEGSTPGPSTLARRIQSLISSFPSMYTPTQLSTSLALANPDIIKLLSSPQIMNGENPTGSAILDPKTKNNVWALLDRMGLKGGKKQETIMLCAPLDAKSDEDVTEAESIDVEMEDEGDEPPEALRFERPILLLEAGPPGQADDGTLAEGQSSGSQAQRPKPKRKVKVFIPSKEKVSVKAAWWGFTIYLPVPVLIILNDKQLKAAQRGAMLIAALQWILNHVPTKALPPQAAATMAVLKTMMPILGALGGAIAVAWQGVRKYDNGLGVKLSATWLLPMILIPSSWELADDHPGIQEADIVAAST